MTLQDESAPVIPFDSTAIAALAAEHSLCVTGPALDVLQLLGDRTTTSSSLSSGSTNSSSIRSSSGSPFSEEFEWLALLESLCPLVNVFARVSPSQKEAVLLALNRGGRTTLMVGDGTNDVGALKAAHVGISIINDPKLEQLAEARMVSKQQEGSSGKSSSSKDRMFRALAELEQIEQDPTIVKLGDASIASPFTSRRTSIDSVLTVIRQGRCTLVTTIQIFKILSLNCLVSVRTACVCVC